MRRNLYESAGWPALRALLKSLPSGPKKSGAFVILAILLLAFFSFRPWDGPPAEPDLPASADGEICAVERVVDGDTLIVLSNGQRQRVRLIGCDTPETVKKGTPVERFGPEASEHTKKRVAEFGGTVLPESDGDRFDRYDRRLALVWLGRERSTMLNEELIRLGLARATLKYRFSDAVKERFRQAQKSAQQERLGIWSEDSLP